MNYFPWALLALVTYSAVPPLMSVATTGDVSMSSNVAAFYSNVLLVVGSAVVVVATGEEFVPALTHPKMPYVLAAGVFLTVGILAYYYALSLGPVSVVTPVFGMFLVGASVIGAVWLGEPVTARKVVGVGFAVLAVYLVTT